MVSLSTEKAKTYWNTKIQKRQEGSKEGGKGWNGKERKVWERERSTNLKKEKTQNKTNKINNLLPGSKGSKVQNARFVALEPVPQHGKQLTSLPGMSTKCFGVRFWARNQWSRKPGRDELLLFVVYFAGFKRQNKSIRNTIGLDTRDELGKLTEACALQRTSQDDASSARCPLHCFICKLAKLNFGAAQN